MSAATLEGPAVEIWRPIAEDPRYRVSSQGRVQSPRGILHSNSNHGYLSVMISGQRRRYIHRLVADAFLGDVIDYDVDHIDSNPRNNDVSNLQIVSHARNQQLYSERRTHCAHGHELTPDNTMRRGKSLRACKACTHERDHKKYLRQKARRHA